MIIPRLGLPSNRRLPLLYVGDRGHPPHDYLRLLMKSRGWLIRDAGTRAECRHLGEALSLCGEHAVMAMEEWGLWLKTYLPPGGVVGMTILDVGAGCGETCHFFFSQGASKVVAIESNPECARNLEENARRSSWNVEVVSEPFRPRHLREFIFDMMKMDIEGAEAELLALDFLPKAVIETHNVSVTNALCERFGMRILENRGNNLSLITNL